MPRKGGKEFRLERAEMLRLRPGQWLTDPVVNLYTERPQALIPFCLVLLSSLTVPRPRCIVIWPLTDPLTRLCVLLPPMHQCCSDVRNRHLQRARLLYTACTQLSSIV